MTAATPATDSYDPAFLLAVLVAAKSSRDETLVAVAETALAEQGILVTFAATTLPANPTTPALKKRQRKTEGQS